jgi:predicted secreted protein
MMQLHTKIQLLTNEIDKHFLDLAFTLILQEMKEDRSRLHLQQTQQQNTNNEVPQQRCATSRGYKIKLEEKASMGTNAQQLKYHKMFNKIA